MSILIFAVIVLLNFIAFFLAGKKSETLTLFLWVNKIQITIVLYSFIYYKRSTLDFYNICNLDNPIHHIKYDFNLLKYKMKL